MQLSLAQDFRQAAAVYIATVVVVPTLRKGAAATTTFRLKVDRVFKGSKSTLNQVLKANDNCQFYFQVGKTYLIYADNEHSPTMLSVNKCSRTKEVFAAKPEELADLQRLAAKAGSK